MRINIISLCAVDHVLTPWVLTSVYEGRAQKMDEGMGVYDSLKDAPGPHLSNALSRISAR